MHNPICKIFEYQISPVRTDQDFTINHDPLYTTPTTSRQIYILKFLVNILMKKESRRDNILLSRSARRSLEGPSALPFIHSDDVDFQDVFGGPPRRFSLHETTRYSSDGAMDVKQTAKSRSSSSEKPVFGEGSSLNRRTHQSSDFFDDIFQGAKSRSSIMRPYEPFGTSLPPQFSLLSATMTKAVDNPTFGSTALFRKKEDTSNGISCPNYSLSRFSVQAKQGHYLTSNVQPSNCSRPSSNEVSQRNKKSSGATKYDETGFWRDPKRDSDITEAPTDTEHSHFSIYNWAGGEVPLVMPSPDGINSNVNEKNKLKRWSSFDRRIRSDEDCELLPENACDRDTHTISANMVSQKLDKLRTLERAEACNIVEKGILTQPKPDMFEAAQATAKNVSEWTMFSNRSDETNLNYLPEISRSEKTKNEVSMVTEKVLKPVPKTLHSFLHDDIEAKDDEDITMKTGGKVNVAKATKVFGSNVGPSKNVKKYDGEKIDSNSTEVNKGSIQRSSKIPEENLKRSGVRVKVKNFVRMFNQQTYSKPKNNLGCQSQSFGSEGKVTCGEVDDSNLNTSEIDAVMHFSNLNAMLDALFEPERHHSQVESTFFATTDNSIESIPDDSEVRSDKINDHFQEKYMMQELFDNQAELQPTSEDHKANKDLDAKILKWSTGKEGNIRSLISTLQYVLWAESGWKPVPLVNIIELNEVKKSYQKALLCLHPDKIQQKGADSHQKYLAEKVFDILQEAWDHFNSLDPL